jgi:hypothetical protein
MVAVIALMVNVNDVMNVDGMNDGVDVDEVMSLKFTTENRLTCHCQSIMLQAHHNHNISIAEMHHMESKNVY